MYRFPKNVRSAAGFTLIEMILYVSICAVLLLSLSAFYVFMLSGRVKSQAITDVEQQGLQVSQLITQTVRNARSLDTPSVGSSGTLLSVTMINSLLNPTTFDANASGTLRIKEGSGAYIPLTNSHVVVQGLSFNNVSSASSADRILRFTFTLSYKNPSGRNEYSYSKAFVGSATLRQ